MVVILQQVTTWYGPLPNGQLTKILNASSFWTLTVRQHVDNKEGRLKASSRCRKAALWWVMQECCFCISKSSEVVRLVMMRLLLMSIITIGATTLPPKTIGKFLTENDVLEVIHHLIESLYKSLSAFCCGRLTLEPFRVLFHASSFSERSIELHTFSFLDDWDDSAVHNVD